MQIFKKSKTLLLVAILLLAVILALAIGTVNVNFSHTVSVLLNKIFGIKLGDGVTKATEVIIWDLRLPRVLLAMFVGAALAISGAITQSVLKNPLASPFTLGISSGASLCVALFIVLDISFSFMFFSSLSIAGFVGGLLTMFLIMKVSRLIDKKVSNFTIILVGMIFSLFLSSMTTLSATLVGDRKYREITEWALGTFANKGIAHVIGIIPWIVIGIIGLLTIRKELDILSFGEEEALNIGVDVKNVKRKAIAFSMLLAGAAIAVSGVIGFVGLVVPHVIRKVYGSKHGVTIPLCAIGGAVFMILADLVARILLPPIELPVGAVTAFIGAPFFIIIFVSRRKKNA